MKNRFLPFLFFSFLIINTQYAQRFGLAAVTGINLGQIDGDNQRGFKKKGIVAGIRSIVNFNEKWNLHTEMLYSQHGTSPSDYRNISINLNYIETPIYLSYKISDYKKTGIVRVYTGVSYGKLLSHKTTEIFTSSNTINEPERHLSLNEVSSYFNKTDIGTFLGVHLLPFDEHIGIDLRYTLSANLLFDKNDVKEPIKNKSLRSYFFSLRFFYEINHIGTKKRKKRRRRRR